MGELSGRLLNHSSRRDKGESSPAWSQKQLSSSEGCRVMLWLSPPLQLEFQKETRKIWQEAKHRHCYRWACNKDIKEWGTFG